MQLRDYAESILLADTLEGKLRRPSGELLDDAPGQAVRIDTPTRPSALPIAAARAVKVPPIAGMQDKSQRRRILHALANHELQAAELFAWALCAFPGEAKGFRRGLLQILVEEQEHCELYIQCLEDLGGEMGDYPVTGHFWGRIGDVRTALEFVCVMGLTFENANIDFAGDYRRAALEVGDQKMADAIEVVHRDEKRHVAFALRWLLRLKDPSETPWEAFTRNIQFPLSPARARGSNFDKGAREEIGFDADFIARLEEATALRPNGMRR